jgi:hypothetical protein
MSTRNHRGRTNNPKFKDDRSGIVVFNEVHQYENFKNIKVFITAWKEPIPAAVCTTHGRADGRWTSAASGERY